MMFWRVIDRIEVSMNLILEKDNYNMLGIGHKNIYEIGTYILPQTHFSRGGEGFLRINGNTEYCPFVGARILKINKLDTINGIIAGTFIIKLKLKI